MSEIGEIVQGIGDSVRVLLLAIVAIVVVSVLAGADLSNNLPPQAQQSILLTSASFQSALGIILAAPDVGLFILGFSAIGAILYAVSQSDEPDSDLWDSEVSSEFV